MTTNNDDWEPTSTFEEKLKNIFVPPSLYFKYRAHRERRRGEAELSLIPFLCDPNKVSIDIGANKGVYTYWLSQASAHVYAYEPNPKIFKILEAGSRGTSNVTVSPVALSDKTGNSVLRVPLGRKGYSNQGASLNYDKVGDSYGEASVELRPLDDEKIQNVGLIKIDVEGHEFEVLEGAKQTIAKYHPVLIIEIEQAHNRIPILESIDRVAAMGYRPMFLWKGVLTDFSAFDPARHHNPEKPAEDRDDYIFNFIFLPKSNL